VLTQQERQDLLRLARRAIAARLAGGEPSAIEQGTASAEGLRAGAFVTLHVGGDLRGCIGYPWGDRPLRDVIVQCAIGAATEDPRFPALSPEELGEADIEISVLGPIEPVDDLKEIEVGRHGLIAEQGYRRGLLLPQVAIEHAWNREMFLSHTCLKAGLSADAWKSGAVFFKFEAEVFGEEPKA
jgi:AmmeMemoRadiSam system protein A